MLRRRKMAGVLCVLLALCLSYEAYPRTPSPADDPTAGWPKVLVQEVDDVARSYVNEADDITKAGSTNQPIFAAINRILVYAVADSLTKGNVQLKTLEAHQYMGETRPDPQTGSSSSSAGSTSAIEKAGLVKLIGLAIDRGAIQKAVSGTSLTLSTSPYALAALAQGDTTGTEEKFGGLRRIGILATYTITDESQLLANLRRKQLDQFSVRVRLTGDRSTLTKDFEKKWYEKVGGKIQRRLVVLTKEEADLFVNNRRGNFKFNALRARIPTDLHDDIVKKLKGFTEADDRAKRIATVKQVIVDKLTTEIYKKDAKDLGLDESDVKRMNEQFIPNLVAAHNEFLEGRKLLEDLLDDLEKKWLITLTYTSHPNEMGSNYSEIKLAGERGLGGPYKIVFNANGSFYHDPDPILNQERFKGFKGALSFEYAVTPNYLKDTTDLGQIKYSFTGNYERIQENLGLPMKAANIGVAQFKASFPISNGVNIPLSISYATSTDLIKEAHVRGNFGISFDLDKFSALAHKVLKP